MEPKLRSPMLQKAGPASLSRLYRHISPRRRKQLALLLVLMLAGAFAELVSLGAVLPFLTLMSDPGRLRDYPLALDAVRALGWEGQPPLLPMTLLFACVTLAGAGIRVLLSWASNRFVFMLGYDLGSGVYRNSLCQPYQFYVSRNTSEIISSMNNVQMISAGVLLPLMQVLISITISAFLLTALMAIDARTASIAGAGFTVIYLLVTLTMRRRLRANSVVIARSQAERIQVVQEGLGGIRNLILDGTQDVYLKKFSAVETPLREAQGSNNFVAQAPRYLIESAGMVLIAVLAYGISLRPGGVTAALPVLGAIALGAQKLMPLLQQIYYGWTRLAGSWAVIEELVELLELPLRPEYSQRAAEPLPFHQAIRLDDVSFRYSDDGPWILKHLQLTIPKGSRCGLIGRTGSGKSTAVDLVMGLLEATQGALWVDEQLLSANNRKAWWERVAHVPQAIYLSDASIAENIALGVEPSRIDMDRVRHVAKQAQIADFVESQAAGYQSLVGERGVRLSGGQRQRIGIARALYKHADVLILDEATSALDDATEKAVIECIEGLDREMTVIIIAHRLSTVRSCDLVVRLEGGRVAAQGTYADVVPSADPKQSFAK